MTAPFRPVSLTEARQFVAAHHRHSKPPHGWKFGTGIERDGELRAVGMVGRPCRELDDGYTCELTRVCTLGDKYDPSRLYGALCRAAQAVGYRLAVTYTLASEPGTSLKAAGFVAVARTRLEETYARPSRPRHDRDIWGEPLIPQEAKVRWERVL